MSNDEIIFNDPEEQDLESLLETHAATEVEPSHTEIVAEVQKKAREAKSESKPQGESLQEHPGGAVPLPHEKRQQSFCVNGKMLSKAEYDAFCQNQDPDLYNFLLKAQRSQEIIDEAGPRACGGDPRWPDEEQLTQAQGHICPHCLRELDEEDCDLKQVGSLIYYGKDEAGEPLIWHYSCWMTQVLLWSRGNVAKACEKFGGTPLELLVWRKSSGYCWNRLGMVRGD